MVSRRTHLFVSFVVVIALWNLWTHKALTTKVSFSISSTRAPASTPPVPSLTPPAAPPSFPTSLVVQRELERLRKLHSSELDTLYVLYFDKAEALVEVEHGGAHDRVRMLTSLPHPPAASGGVIFEGEDKDLLARQAQKMSGISRKARAEAGVGMSEAEEITRILAGLTTCRYASNFPELLVPAVSVSPTMLDLLVVGPTEAHSALKSMNVNAFSKVLQSVASTVLVRADAKVAEMLRGTLWEPLSVNQSIFAMPTNGDILSFNRYALLDCYPRVETDRMNPLCEDNTIRIHSIIQLGSKTAIYKATVNGQDVALKHFHYWHYRRFTGFLHLVTNSTLRSPLINYPTGACIDRKLDNSVFQAQPLLTGMDLLKLKKRTPELSWGLRLDIALQLACVFQHLHEHPHGPYTYDDIHPGQFFVAGLSNPSMLFVDLDTIQLTMTKERTSVCRCFYCNGGRAMCIFMNSPEGYRFCGQGGLVGDKTQRCGPRTDMWFIGQLYNHLLPGSRIPLAGLSEKDLVAAVQGTRRPKLDSGDSRYDRLIMRMWEQDPSLRLTPREVVIELLALCGEEGSSHKGCTLTQCPAERRASSPYFGFR